MPVLVVCALAVLIGPPLVARALDDDEPPERGRELAANPVTLDSDDDHSEFEQFFPDQPGAIELSEELSLWGWDHGGPYGWMTRDRETDQVVVRDGHRRTLQVPEPRVTVWLFGGSTVFGFGQRDEHTIASEMVRVASERGVPIEVVNYGVSGWVNWQETMWFSDELDAGRRPDLAVFLDGANDMALGLERERYGLLDPSKVEYQTMSDEERDALAADARARGYESRGDLDLAVDLAAGQYRRGVLSSREVAQEHGVEVVHFWQPQLYTVPIYAPLVREAMEIWQLDEEQHELLGGVAQRIPKESGVDPIDLTSIFDDVDRPVFYDTTHTNEYGARLTAEAIVDELWPRIEELAGS